MERRFGRLYHPDPRDRLHLMRRAVAGIELPESRMWQAEAALDQDGEDACVGFSWTQFLRAAPRMHADLDFSFAMWAYREAQKNDEWPGEDYAGSSVRGGAKAMQADGKISEYIWAFQIGDVKRFLLGRGPVVAGSDWFDGMMETDSKGYVHPTGSPVGGHAYLLVGYSATRNAFRILNSWGTEWGQAGRAWIAYADMQYLLEGLNGEACSALEVAKP